jgi:hypothetical protein
LSDCLALALLDLGRDDFDPLHESEVHAEEENRCPQPWTKEYLRQLKVHSRAKTRVVDVAKAMKRTEGAVR